MKKLTTKLLLAAVIASALTACGGMNESQMMMMEEMQGQVQEMQGQVNQMQFEVNSNAAAAARAKDMAEEALIKASMRRADHHKDHMDKMMK